MKRVLVQAGHMPPLQPHHESQTGAPGEAELVADIQRALVRLMSQDEHFHPLVFFYVFGLLMASGGLALGIAEVVLRIMGNQVTAGSGILVALLLIFGSQFTLFAMWFDMESNKDLK